MQAETSFTEQNRSHIITGNNLKRSIINNYQLYLIIFIPLVYIIIFNYIPMYGAQIAFRNFNASKGIWGSQWVGLKHFINFFNSYEFWTIIKNTLGISLYQLIAGFPIPIILALTLNNTENYRYKKIVQTTTYIPFFISTVVMVGMIIQFLSTRTGVVNIFIQSLGFEPVSFMNEAKYFRSIYVWSGIWQNSGWGSIIYLAALSGIDQSLHEAARVDGATKFKRVLHIDIPGIMPTVVILLIMNTGSLMNIGFEKVFLMQNPLNLSISEIIQTYVYKTGLAAQIANYSFSTAVGLFNSVINLILILIVNQIAKKVGDISLW